jgi:hypothetical protein
MDIESFLKIKEFDKISQRLGAVQDEMKLNSFNLFTISSYNSYLENFHSDIIALLLDPQERHLQNNAFLNLFLDYLIVLGAQIDKNDYALCEITREVGRIDIWLKDITSKKSIIVENKINNAGDQENQLENYYSYAKNAGYDVDAVVYLTLQGNKKAPYTDIEELNEKIINVQAFDSANDLCTGWLDKCFELAQDEHCRSFIFQYQKLIKHLSQMGMDRQIKDDFYNVINKEDGYTKTRAIADLVTGLEQYRADIFADKIGNDYLPFRKIYRWRPNYWLFEKYIDNKIGYKLDVEFYSTGTVRIDFWTPKYPPEVQEKYISDKLKAIGLYDEFQHGGFGGGMFKTFDLKDFKTIGGVDTEVYTFVKSFFEKLR